MVTFVSPTPGSRAAADDDGGRPLIWGVGAALLGGGIWALIVGVTQYEVGWVAWGVGGLVGLAMSRATRLRTTGLAATAAGLAVLGLLFGKVLIQVMILGPAIEQELRANAAAPVAATWDLQTKKAFPALLQARIDALAETDTIPDALWAEMMEAGEMHAASLTEEERVRLTAAYVAAGMSHLSAWRQLLWSFTPWDLLWLGLAITTAWRMMKAPPKTEEGAAAA